MRSVEVALDLARSQAQAGVGTWLQGPDPEQGVRG